MEVVDFTVFLLQRLQVYSDLSRDSSLYLVELISSHSVGEDMKLFNLCKLVKITLTTQNDIKLCISKDYKTGTKLDTYVIVHKLA